MACTSNTGREALILRITNVFFTRAMPQLPMQCSGSTANHHSMSCWRVRTATLQKRCATVLIMPIGRGQQKGGWPHLVATVQRQNIFNWVNVHSAWASLTVFPARTSLSKARSPSKLSASPLMMAASLCTTGPCRGLFPQPDVQKPANNRMHRSRVGAAISI